MLFHKKASVGFCFVNILESFLYLSIHECIRKRSPTRVEQASDFGSSLLYLPIPPPPKKLTALTEETEKTKHTGYKKGFHFKTPGLWKEQRSHFTEPNVTTPRNLV